MTKYEEFLNICNIIPEDLFYDIINSLPEFDIKDVDFSNAFYDLDSKDIVCRCIIDSILSKWSCVYTNDVDFDNKTIELEDVESLNDLEEIKNTLSKWVISNYEDIKTYLEKEEKEKNEYDEKYKLMNSIINIIPLEELRKIVKKYVN